jgi:(2Fe-2S) ferredoxin
LGKRRYYVLLCTNERPADNPKGSCVGNGSIAVRDAFTEVIEREGLRSAVRVVKTSCLDNCARGPVLAIFPDDVWYQGVSAADVPEIVESHLKRGQPVERLLLRPAEFG